MEPWAGALAALVDDRNNLKGTGFVCQAGVLVTCAHNVGGSGCVGSEVTAMFGEGGTRRTLRFRVAGWFGRKANLLHDEDDALCDVAVLKPLDAGAPLPPGPAIVDPAPSGGTLEIIGYYTKPNGGRGKDTIRATLLGTEPPGWLRAKPMHPQTDAPIAGMSGSPAFHESIEGVVGMLAQGQEQGRGVWLLVPGEALARAIEKVLGPRDGAQEGPRLRLEEIERFDASEEYAVCELYSPRQDAKPGEDLRARLSAIFRRVPEGMPRLRQVSVHVELPAKLGVEARLGHPDGHRCANGVVIKCTGVQKKPSWEVRAPPDETLHDKNLDTDDAPLFRLPGAEAGQSVKLRMVAFANKDFFQAEDIPEARFPPKGFSRAREQIIRRLHLKTLSAVNDRGEIELCVTDNVVEEVAE